MKLSPIYLLLVSTLFSLPVKTPREEKPVVSRPNIILYSIDTLRADHLACYGYPRDTSPFIDKFAKEAVLFSHALSQAPLTTPSHMSLFTALTPAVHQVKQTSKKGIINRLGKNIPTLAQILKTNGYLTMGLHGRGAMEKSFGFGKGFDTYTPLFTMPKTFTNPEELRQKADSNIQNLIERSKKIKQPFFLFLHHYYCHDPYLKGPKNYRLKFLTKPAPGLLTGVKQFGPDFNYSNIDKKFDYSRAIMSIFIIPRKRPGTNGSSTIGMIRGNNIILREINRIC